jgi:hypothetical protein
VAGVLRSRVGQATRLGRPHAIMRLLLSASLRGGLPSSRMLAESIYILELPVLSSLSPDLST